MFLALTFRWRPLFFSWTQWHICNNFTSKWIVMDFRESAVEAMEKLHGNGSENHSFAVVIMIALCLFYSLANYSEGARTGYVVKISKKGVIFKTNEGELNFGFPGSAQRRYGESNIWNFFSTQWRSGKMQTQRAAETGTKSNAFYHRNTMHYSSLAIRNILFIR